MLGAYLRRGLAAGLIAGVFAGLVGLLVGARAIDAAEDLAHAADHGHDDEGHGHDDGHDAEGHGHDDGGHGHDDGGHGHDDDAHLFSRTQQKAGLVGGTGLVGLGFGLVFAVAAAWAAGRLQGDAWLRSVKLGASALGAVVLLPALAYPPMPPGAGDPDTVGTRMVLYVGTAGLGLLLAAGAYTGNRQLAQTRLQRPARQALLAAGVIAAGAAILVALPSAGTVGGAAGTVSADLVWEFRVGSLATQLAFIGGLAVVFGLLSTRAEHQAR
jgi:hypothetical protein